jgi:hypothetical protein
LSDQTQHLASWPNPVAQTSEQNACKCAVLPPDLVRSHEHKEVRERVPATTLGAAGPESAPPRLSAFAGRKLFRLGTPRLCQRASSG